MKINNENFPDLRVLLTQIPQVFDQLGGCNCYLIR